MYIYYAPIAIALVSILVSMSNDRRADLSLLIAIATFVILVSGFRYFSDVDYAPYVDLYEQTPTIADFGKEDMRLLYGEPGYLLLTSMVKSTGAEFLAVTIISALLSIVAKSFVAYKFVKNASFAVAIYLCLSFITIEFIQMRWAVATGLMCCAYYCQFRMQRNLAIAFFVSAVLFHYFSIFFVILSFFTRISGHMKYFVFLALAMGFSLVAKIFGFSFTYEADTDVYLITRFLRYLNDPLSSVGVFSYLKIVFYAVSVYSLGRLRDCDLDIENDRTFGYLFRLSFLFMSAALVVSVIPIFFFRTMVMADFFSILLIAYMLSRITTMAVKMAYIYAITIMFSTWCWLDVGNVASADRITEYESWLKFLL